MHVHKTPVRALASALVLGCATQLAACGGGATEAGATESQSRPDSARMATAPAPLWNADGSALSSPTSPLTRSAAQWSGQRYATRDQLAHEELVAAPYTLVIDADDEAAVESGLQLADTVHAYAGGKTTLGVFVRSRNSALAARLAERLTLEQGWANVFVVQ
jgi:hypothetical protein